MTQVSRPLFGAQRQLTIVSDAMSCLQVSKGGGLCEFVLHVIECR